MASGRYEDLTGKKFGKLTVIQRAGSTPNRASRWLCQCDCGNTTIAVTTRLKSGYRVSCGCTRRYKSKNGDILSERELSRPKYDLTGKIYGRLTVIEWKRNREVNKDMWLCRCECGKHAYVKPADLERGDRTSCGCSARTSGEKTHGMSRTPEYRTWSGMVHRCTNPRMTGYENYGGRGITVCAAWLNSFEQFFQDMGNRPKGKTLDRINNDDGCHCGKCEECKRNGWVANCRWATWKQQAANRRPKNKPVEGV